MPPALKGLTHSYSNNTMYFVSPIPEQPTPLVGDCNTILYTVRVLHDRDGSDNLPASTKLLSKHKTSQMRSLRLLGDCQNHRDREVLLLCTKQVQCITVAEKTVEVFYLKCECNKESHDISHAYVLGLRERVVDGDIQTGAGQVGVRDMSLFEVVVVTARLLH